MTTRKVLRLVASLTTTSLTTTSCFYDGAPPAHQPLLPQVGQLTLHDHGGATFAAESAPRDLELRLPWLDAAPSAAPEQLASALLLLRGPLDLALAERLHRARASESVRARTIALRVESDAHGLRARPLPALEPGAIYTLFFQAGAEARAFGLTIARGPELGARLLESWPSRAASAPRNLQRVLVRFDGFVADLHSAPLRLHELGGDVLPVELHGQRCSALGLPEGDCVWLMLQQPLRARARYVLALDAGLLTRTGAPISPVQIEFGSGELEDHEPPNLDATRCAADEQSLAALCVCNERTQLTLRGSASEAALVQLSMVLDSGVLDGSVHTVAALTHANAFELALPPPASPQLARLRLVDLAGNTREIDLTLPAGVPIAQLEIDEIAADPRGKEPAQEWIELLNSGSSPESLMGFSLSTDEFAPGRAVLAAPVLAPHERVLLVGPDFDPRAEVADDDDDGELPSGVRLVALDGALSISNSGDTLYLRDALGRRVSTARALPALFAGQCTARVSDLSAHEASVPLPARFELDPHGRCSPGDATFPAP